MIKSLKTINFSSNLRVVFHYFLLFGVVLFFSGIIASCTKKPTLIGKGIIPDSTMTAFYTDTMAIRTYSTPFDSSSTNEKSYYIVGSMTDPVFGTTESGFYTQLGQAVTHDRFGPNAQVDSLILQLAYSTVYGDTNSVLRLHVYELDEDLEGDSTTYYSNKIPNYFPTDYADYTFKPHVSNQVILNNGTDTVTGVIRVNLSKINPDLANKLIQTDTTDLDSNYLFVKYFKGLYVTADLVSGKGAIVSFSPSSYNTQLGLYYHNDTVDSLSFYYLYGTGMAYANHYAHDFTKGSAELQQQVLQHDTVLGQQQFYVQGLSGVKTIIKFPNVQKLARLGKIGINEAKLILPGKGDLYYDAPTSLTLLKITSDTSFQTLTDQNEGTSYFGGTYDSTSNTYQFRITHYIQSLVSDTTQGDPGLLLYTYGGTIYPQRFIFNGPAPVNDTLSRTKLELLYTKFN